MKKIVIISLLFLLLISNNLSFVSAKSDYYTNNVGINFTKKEFNHILNSGVSQLEISIITEEEKDFYLGFDLDNVIIEEKYVKTKIKKVKDEISGEETIIQLEEIEISEEEAESLVFSINNPEPVDEMIMSTSSTINYTEETNVRKITTTGLYYYAIQEMYIKVSVEWLTIPSDRGWDLIGIAHEWDSWYIDTYQFYDTSINDYIQKADWSAKQIYEWSAYDSRLSNNVDPNPEIIHINYTENSTDNDGEYYYQSTNMTEGIVIKQNLKNNEVEAVTAGLDPYEYYGIGYIVTQLELTLTVYFDLGDALNFGSFVGLSMHQESFMVINWEEVSITFQYPYIYLPLGLFELGTRYENGIEVSISVPMVPNC